MTDARIRALIPMYAAKTEDVPPPQNPRFGFDDWFRDFKRQNGIALLLLFAWAASMMLGCCITGVIVRNRTTKRVTDEVTSKLRAGFEEYLAQQEAERKAAEFLTGDASLEAAILDLGQTYIAPLLATYRMEFGTSEEGCLTLGWTFIARLLKQSSEFGKTAQEILERKGAWEGNPVGHAVANQDVEMGTAIARDFYTGHYPDGFTADFTFGAREANGGFVARNEFITGPNTVYLRIKK